MATKINQTMDSSDFFTLPTVSSYSNIKLLNSSETGFNQLFMVEREGKLFVAKSLKDKHKGDPLYESILRKEFEIGYNLNNVNICHTYAYENFNELGNTIVMEYIDGRTLDTYIAERKRTNKELKRIITQICQALNYAHNHQIIHRDIKPQNILITNNGDNVKLIDFGLSDTDYHSALKEPAGSRKYASPEQIRGYKLNNRSDIYSLGIVITVIYKGRVPKKIERIVTRCCKENPQERYASCHDLSRAINTKYTYWYIAIAIIVAIVGVLLYVNLHKSSTSIVVLNNNSIEINEKYSQMSAQYYAYYTTNTNPTNINPLGEISNFSEDSLKFVASDRERIDSIFSNPADRDNIYYKTLVEQNYGATHYANYHRMWIEGFFSNAERLFSRAKDSYATTLKTEAEPIKQRYNAVADTLRNLYGEEAEEANRRFWNLKCEYHKATALKYLIYLRNNNKLDTIPAEFTTFYDRRRR